MNSWLRLWALGGVVDIAMAAIALGAPPPPPNLYVNGPQSPWVAITDISAPERVAYALYEAAMQQAEAAILASSCSKLAGSYAITAFTDASVNNPINNFVEVDSPAGSFTLAADVSAFVPFRGQKIAIAQAADGALNGVPLKNYQADVSYNGTGNLMVLQASMQAQGSNGDFIPIAGETIKDFYNFVDPITNDDYIQDWGVQSLSKLGDPAEVYWQRSKSRRDDNTPGRTVFVKDRLVGPTVCHIRIDTHDYNNLDYFYQSGTLAISNSGPFGALF